MEAMDLTAAAKVMVVMSMHMHTSTTTMTTIIVVMTGAKQPIDQRIKAPTFTPPYHRYTGE